VRTDCPACRSGRTIAFLDLGEVPVFCNVQWATREEALAAATGPLSLSACLGCGHVFNHAFDAERLAYAPGYENSQHASSVFRSYAQRLVDRLIGQYGVRNRAVVDIGCGRGDLLAMLCERGGNHGFGFDPSYAGTTAAEGDQQFIIQREYFGPEHAAMIQPSLVTCRHVLEHVEDPVAFLRTLRTTIEACGDTVLYIEVPSGEELLSSLGLWDYLYEHVSYFSAQSLEAVLNAAGFEVLAMRRDFGGQFLCADARVAVRASPIQPSNGQSAAFVRSAAQGMLERLQHWRRWASDLPLGGGVSIWGAGSKGVMFMNLLGLRVPGKVERVVDQNFDKHGRFLSGTAQEIVGPDSLHELHMDEIILMNGIYESEIRAKLASIGSAPTLKIAWP
jgi:SAM-dependent methyltransferase